MFLAELDERGKLFPNAGQFRMVLRVRVFADSELLLVRVVAWIDAYLFHPFGRFHGRFRLEVNVCHQRHIAAMRAESIRDISKIGSIFDGRRGDSDDLTTDRDEFQRLADALIRVHRIARQHRLDADRMGSAERHLAHANFAGLAPRIRVRTATITEAHLDCSVTSFCPVTNMSPTSKKVT